nr:universal stress protein [Rhodovulum imhoffii]
MTPVDLSHLDRLERALSTSADLARHYHVPVTYVAVTTEQPSKVAHTTVEFEQKLNAFAAEQAARHKITAHAKMMISHDPATDLDARLRDALEETGADLVVMASHLPNLGDYIWPSHGGKLASHASASVFLVREHAG